MKKISILFVVLMLIVSMAGCQLFITVTEEEAEEAFAVSYGAYVLAAFSIAFGGTVPGATVDGNGVLTFSNFDVSDLSDTDSYTTMSGTFSPTADSGVSANVTFEGGPVSTLTYTVGSEFLTANTGDTVTIAMVANGKSFTIVYVAE